MRVSWFPGHMKKALRVVKESLPLVNLVLVVLDARIPSSSRNPEIEGILAGREVLFLLNKSDLASPQATSRWLSYFKGEGLAVSSRSGEGFKMLRKMIEERRGEVVESRKKRGRRDEEIRLMVMGIPNVGKSSVINRLSGRNVVRVGKNPGVTRGLQWIALPGNGELLDIPGIFYPRVDNEEHAWHLAAVGTVREELLPVDELALKILSFLSAVQAPCLKGMTGPPAELLEQIGRKMGLIGKEASVDAHRTALSVIKSFREGTYGPFTLEEPPHESPGGPHDA
ncbi:MAG: ribosome biogenesis GTPase YlqF [Candidatus Eremiobacteraeota bacterium]|nr:ribosome biogenesis GTPase YlqF [Candidatus Eremiobacteraeota bacterium]